MKGNNYRKFEHLPTKNHFETPVEVEKDIMKLLGLMHQRRGTLERGYEGRLLLEVKA